MHAPRANVPAALRREEGPLLIHLLAAVIALVAGAASGAVASALASPEARASSPQPDGGAAYEVTTCRGEGFALTAPEYESVTMHNRAREEAGLAHLCVNPTLTRAARGHAADMLERDYFSHDSPGEAGVEPIDRMMDACYSGYSTYGENTAYATGPLADSRPIFDSLMESPGHRENILRDAFLEVGVGAVGNGSTGMYAMDFGARPGQPHDYPQLFPSPEGEAPPPDEEAATHPAAPPSPDDPPQQAYETSEDSGGQNSSEESSGAESPEVSDPRQAILCEIFSERSLSIFADAEADGFAYDPGRTFLDPPSCGR